MHFQDYLQAKLLMNINLLKCMTKFFPNITCNNIDLYQGDENVELYLVSCKKN
jgi:hypothetical protein